MRLVFAAAAVCLLALPAQALEIDFVAVEANRTGVPVGGDPDIGQVPFFIGNVDNWDWLVDSAVGDTLTVTQCGVTTHLTGPLSFFGTKAVGAPISGLSPFQIGLGTADFGSSEFVQFVAGSEASITGNFTLTSGFMGVAAGTVGSITVTGFNDRKFQAGTDGPFLTGADFRGMITLPDNCPTPPPAVPEPTTLALVVLGGLGVVSRRRG